MMKEIRKGRSSRIKDRAGAQKSSPAANIKDKTREARQVMVRQELIIPDLLFSAARNLIIPISKPSLEEVAKNVIAAIKALTIPISAGG